MPSLPREDIDVKILLNAIATLSKDLDTFRGHLADFKKLIQRCRGSVSIAWPDEDWKMRNGSVGGSGCDEE